MPAIHRPSPKPKRYFYVPQDDITPHELARLVPFLVGILNTNQSGPWVYNAHHYMPTPWSDAIEKLPDDLKRHFTTERPPSETI